MTMKQKPVCQSTGRPGDIDPVWVFYAFLVGVLLHVFVWSSAVDLWRRLWPLPRHAMVETSDWNRVFEKQSRWVEKNLVMAEQKE